MSTRFLLIVRKVRQQIMSHICKEPNLTLIFTHITHMIRLYARNVEQIECVCRYGRGRGRGAGEARHLREDHHRQWRRRQGRPHTGQRPDHRGRREEPGQYALYTSHISTTIT